MRITVERHARYGAPAGFPDVRVVEIPNVTLAENLLDEVFKFGQNDFQPQPMPSVSVGDVIRIGDERWLVEPVGFSRLDLHEGERPEFVERSAQ
jgi:hypothetical protein